MAAPAATAAAALGLGGDEEDEEEIPSGAGEDPEDPAGWEADSDFDEEDDPLLDDEAIEELKAEFRNSLISVFSYTELSAEVLQDKLDVSKLVDLIQTWGSDSALELACNNLIRGAHHIVIDGEIPVFRYSMSQDLILYRDWVCLRLSRGLGAEATDFKRLERAFMYNRQCALMDIKESIRLATKSESKVTKFEAKDWMKWYKSIDNHFRCTLGVRGVMLDWVYQEQAELKPRAKYRSIVAKIQATLILEGNHFEEDAASVYARVATSTFAYLYVKQFEDTRNGHEVMLALKLQFGRKEYIVSRSKDTNAIIKRFSSIVPLASIYMISMLPASMMVTMSSCSQRTNPGARQGPALLQFFAGSDHVPVQGVCPTGPGYGFKLYQSHWTAKEHAEHTCLRQGQDRHQSLCRRAWNRATEAQGRRRWRRWPPQEQA
jgi:hypothetical protein